MAQLVQTLSDNTHQNFYEDIRMQGVTCLCSLIIGGGGGGGGGEREREDEGSPKKDSWGY